VLEISLRWLISRWAQKGPIEPSLREREAALANTTGGRYILDPTRFRTLFYVKCDETSSSPGYGPKLDIRLLKSRPREKAPDIEDSTVEHRCTVTLHSSPLDSTVLG